MAFIFFPRKINVIKNFSIFIFLIISYSVSAQENIIYWQTDHRPPASILHGAHQGEGFIDLIRNSLVNQLSEYQHINNTSALDKFFEDMERGKNICHPLLFVTEQRKKFAYFSIPVTITPSVRVVMKAESAQTLNLKSPIDLEKIFDNERTFATIKGRSYGEFIDNVINKQHSSYSHARVSATDNTRLFRLLERERVDFTFAFPFELNYYKKHYNSTKFNTFAIKGPKDYTLGSVACSKNEWGKTVINKINKALLQQRDQEDFISTITLWWPEERKNKAFLKFYKDVFLKSNNVVIN